MSERPQQGYQCPGCGNLFPGTPKNGFYRDDRSIEYLCGGCMDQRIIDMKVRPINHLKIEGKVTFD